MFVWNIKLNIKKILLFSIMAAIITVIAIEGINMIKLFKQNSFDYVLTETNFTNYLKSIHDNMEANIGKTIKLSGFVFTLPDFKENNFVCGRNMILNDDEKVVGFFCEYENTPSLQENEWVEITGIIKPGYYLTNIPVIQVETITKITAPANTYVTPPENNV